jgi:hypothetical protein
LGSADSLCAYAGHEAAVENKYLERDPPWYCGRRRSARHSPTCSTGARLARLLAATERSDWKDGRRGAAVDRTLSL